MRCLGLWAALATCAACSSTAAAPGAREPSNSAATPASDPLPPVQAGSYQLRLSALCERRELTATGILTLRPIAGEEGEPKTEDAVLLWGQADLDFEQLSSCLGGAAPASAEPIHPSVLVAVLGWDGEPHHPVLLVSTEGARSGARRLNGVGIAMWVERIEQDHMSGVWSRWEIMGREEGRWEADLVTTH